MEFRHMFNLKMSWFLLFFFKKNCLHKLECWSLIKFLAVKSLINNRTNQHLLIIEKRPQLYVILFAYFKRNLIFKKKIATICNINVIILKHSSNTIKPVKYLFFTLFALLYISANTLNFQKFTFSVKSSSAIYGISFVAIIIIKKC